MLNLYTINIIEDYLKYGTSNIYTINVYTKKINSKNYIANIKIKHQENVLEMFSIYIGDNYSVYNILRSLSIYKYSILNEH
jgi:hypothetical protein